MKCPICGKEIDDNAKYCLGCGKKIPRCPSCNRVISRSERFCTYDGTRISEEIMSIFETKEEPKADDVKSAASTIQTAHAVSSTASQGMVYNNTNQNKVQRPPKNKIPAWVIAVISVFAVLSVLINSLVAVSVFSSSNSSTQNYVKSDEKETKKKKSKESSTEETEEAHDEIMASLAPDAEQSMENQVPSYETPDATAVVPATLPSQTAPPPPPATYYYVDYGNVLDEFIYYSNSIYYSDSDLAGFDAEMCRLARNGIYARMGRKFKDQGLTDFFSQYYWYNPTIDADSFSDSWLNDCQIHNRDLIVSYERRHGFN